MSARLLTALLTVGLIVMFIVGFSFSKGSGIQVGYFEKAEAPAYGVGGGETLGADLGAEFQDHFENLYEGIED